MGVECNYYLLPRPNTFRPTGDQLSRFVDVVHTRGLVRTEPVHEQDSTRLGSRVRPEKVSIADGLSLIPPSGVPDRDLCLCWNFPNWNRTQARFPFVAEPQDRGFKYWYY